jgi:hypothetical protein
MTGDIVPHSDSFSDNVSSGFVVYPEVIKRHVNDELPFMAT